MEHFGQINQKVEICKSISIPVQISCLPFQCTLCYENDSKKKPSKETLRLDPLNVNSRYTPSCRALAYFCERGLDLPTLETVVQKQFARVLFPWTTEYSQLRLNVNLSYNVLPAMIIYVTTDQQVAKAIAFGRKYNIQIVTRSNGHCYEPFSLCNGMVVDQSLRQGKQIWRRVFPSSFSKNKNCAQKNNFFPFHHHQSPFVDTDNNSDTDDSDDTDNSNNDEKNNKNDKNDNIDKNKEKNVDNNDDDDDDDDDDEQGIVITEDFEDVDDNDDDGDGGEKFQHDDYTKGWETSKELEKEDPIAMAANRLDPRPECLVRRTSPFRVTVQSGIAIGTLVQALSKHGLGLPTGTCAGVGIAGLSLGGGLGFLTRRWGLTCDQLLALEIVLADGRRIKADAKGPHSDLLWAAKGAGGGNFGIVTSFTFRVFPVRMVTIFDAFWPRSELKKVLGGWQRWAPFTDPDLTTEYNIYGGLDEPVQITGQLVGADPEKLLRLLKPLIKVVGQPIDDQKNIKVVPWADAVRYFSGTQRRPPFKNKSDFVDALLPTEALDTIEEFMNTIPEPSNPDAARLEFVAFGGENNLIPPHATAFPHRKTTLFWIQYIVRWEEYQQESAKLRWVREFYRVMTPWVSGFTYV